jgi:hypothetical protein
VTRRVAQIHYLPAVDDMPALDLEAKKLKMHLLLSMTRVGMF